MIPSSFFTFLYRIWALFTGGWCHAKPTMDGVKFVNFTCWKIEENHTLPSIATATKETFTVRKAFMLRNYVLLYLKAHDLRFFHAKFQSPGSNGLATTPFWRKKLVNKFEQILKSEILQYKSKFLQLLKKFDKYKKLMFLQVFLRNLIIFIQFSWN